MKAIRERDGALRWVDHPTPTPAPGQIRVRVRATAVNRADLVQRAGHYPPPPGAPDTLGLECAGVVDAVGAGVQRWAVGDEVVALLGGGGYAEQVCCDARHALPRPPNLSWAEAAAVMEVFATAWLNLRREGALQGGERVLLHAGASGVGTAAIQLCRAWGCPVFATVGGEEKRRRCEALGAGATADRHAGPWLEAVRDWGRPDVVLCPVGASYLADNVAALAPGGRLVLIGLLGGATGELPLGAVLVKRLTVRGSVLRSRSPDDKAAVVEGVGRDVWPLLLDGRVRPIVEAELPVDRAGDAHEMLRSNRTVGKLALRVP